MNFEMHITCSIADRVVVNEVAQDYAMKYSAIDGDPLLGAGVHCYLTAHDTNYVRLFTRMKTASGRLLTRGVNVVREKIELIMYDTKTGEGV